MSSSGTIRIAGRRTLLLVVFAIYGVLIFSTAQLGIVIAILVTNAVSTSLGTWEILMIVAVFLSYTYLVLHCLISLWYHCVVAQHRARQYTLRSIALMLTRLMIVAWVATSVAGLLVAIRDPFCTKDNNNNLICKLYRVGVAGSLMCFISSCTLFCCLELSENPFAASLRGVHEIQRTAPMYNTPYNEPLGIESTTMKSEKPPDVPVRDLGCFLMPDTTSEVTVKDVRTSWLPPFAFQISAQPVPSSRPQARPLLARTPTSSTASSVYSQSSSAYSLSRHASTLSSHSSLSPSSTNYSSPLSSMRLASEPKVPVIPEKYRHLTKPHSANQVPWRPSLTHMITQPSWKYSSSQQTWQGQLSAAYAGRKGSRSGSMSSRYQNRTRRSSLTQIDSLYQPVVLNKPVKATSCYTGKPIIMARGVSYESLRKGDELRSQPASEVSKSLVDQMEADKKLAARQRTDIKTQPKRTRTLVKQRQRWDEKD